MTRCTRLVKGRRGLRECGRPAERVYLVAGERWPKCRRCTSRGVRTYAERYGVQAVPA